MSHPTVTEPNSTSTNPTDLPQADEYRASRGRPSGYSERVLEMLKSVIRAKGSSDSAAAVSIGMGASTLTDWKREHPEIKATLLQAREEFRGVQIDRVLGAAQAEGGRGWRAAAWLLERIFPADYAKSANDRRAFEHREERAAERKWRAEEEARLAEALARAEAECRAEDEEWAEDFEDSSSSSSFANPIRSHHSHSSHSNPEFEDENEDEQAATPRPAKAKRVYSEPPFGNCGNSPAPSPSEGTAAPARHAHLQKP